VARLPVIFEMDPGAAQDGAVGRVEHREPGRCAVDRRDDGLRHGSGAEEGLGHVLGLGRDLPGELLRLGELDDEPVQDIDVLGLSRPNDRRDAHRRRRRGPTAQWITGSG